MLEPRFRCSEATQRLQVHGSLAEKRRKRLKSNGKDGGPGRTFNNQDLTLFFTMDLLFLKILIITNTALNTKKIILCLKSAKIP
jgi:hypothetical protein